MKKGEIAEGFVSRTEFPDLGQVLLCPETAAPVSVVVKHVLPGQKIRFRVKKVRKNRCEGELLEVLEPSKDQIPSDCPHFGECGSCVYRELPYEKQLQLKEEQVLRLLEGVVEDPRFEGIKGSPVKDGYRNKMEFSFGDAYKDGPLSLGMHRRGSFYDIVTVGQCRIMDEDFRRILQCVLTLTQAWNLTYYHRVRHTGYLRHLLVRKAAFTGQILVDLVTAADWKQNTGQQQDETEFEKQFTAALRELSLKGEIVGILHTVNNSVADNIEDQGTVILYGQDYLEEKLLDLTFKITPFSFFQTNSRGAEVLYETVREYVGDTKDKEIFDLYSGTGTIAQMLSPVARHVTGVEIVEEAVEAAKENAQRNGLSQCSFLAGDVLKVLDELKQKPDIIILDPPRDGIHPKTLPKIIAYGVDRIIYISCKPTSLARDLVIFRQAGYEVRRSCCVDMFPDTPHVETICLLTRNT